MIGILIITQPILQSKQKISTANLNTAAIRKIERRENMTASAKTIPDTPLQMRGDAL
ncbi:MAG: hypothetical protein ACQCN6_13335 [Candidatus Bathyarchaeia archaeon]|jgi:hypothetical protein